MPAALEQPAAVTKVHPAGVQHAPVAQGVGKQLAPPVNAPEQAAALTTAAQAPTKEQHAPPQGLVGVQVAPMLVKVLGAGHPGAEEVAHAPVVVEQHAPTTLPAPEVQKDVAVQLVPEAYPTPTPEKVFVPAQPAPVVAVQIPLTAQHAPRIAVVWQSVVVVQAMPVTPTPMPRNVALPVHPAGVEAMHPPAAEQHAPREGLQKFVLQAVPEV